MRVSTLLATYMGNQVSTFLYDGLYFEPKNLRSGVASLHKWCHSTREDDGQIWGITKTEIDRPSSTTLSLPENLEREGGRHPKNSSRQFQVGLHIITSLRQRCGGPKQSDGNDCKSLKCFFQVLVRVRPQDICFSRNTQRTTFMSAR